MISPNVQIQQTSYPPPQAKAHGFLNKP